jgi:hypothetical protein
VEGLDVRVLRLPFVYGDGDPHIEEAIHEARGRACHAPRHARGVRTICCAATQREALGGTARHWEHCQHCQQHREAPAPAAVFNR